MFGTIPSLSLSRLSFLVVKVEALFPLHGHKAAWVSNREAAAHAREDESSKHASITPSYTQFILDQRLHALF